MSRLIRILYSLRNMLVASQSNRNRPTPQDSATRVTGYQPHPLFSDLTEVRASGRSRTAIMRPTGDISTSAHSSPEVEISRSLLASPVAKRDTSAIDNAGVQRNARAGRPKRRRLDTFVPSPIRGTALVEDRIETDSLPPRSRASSSHRYELRSSVETQLPEFDQSLPSDDASAETSDEEEPAAGTP